MIRFALFFLLLAVANAQFRSPTGRRVSVRDFPNGLPQQIYEYSNGYFLGPNTRIHIPSQTSELNVDTLRDTVTKININGKREVSRQRVRTEIRHGKGITFMFTKGRLMAVSGTGINLVPLKGYPGLYTNTELNLGSKVQVLHSSREGSIVIEENPDDDDDIAPEIETNGTERMGHFFKSTKQADCSCAGGSRLYYEIAVAYDSTFCDEFGGDEAAASAMIQVLVDASNVAYTRDTCITLSLVHIDAHCNDPDAPYDFRPFDTCPGSSPPCSPAFSILLNFRAFWLNYRSDVEADGAFLFTGYEDGTGTGGIAWLSSACSSFGFGWTEGINLKTFAHEIGHTLGGTHHNTIDGILKQGTITNFGFIPATVQEFTDFVDSSSASCITCDAPMCDATDGGCSAPSCPGNQCVTGQNVPPSLVPCSPIDGNYYCLSLILQTSSNTYEAGVDCPNDGFNYVQRENDPTDPSIVCCALPTQTTTRRMVARNQVSTFRGIQYNGVIYPTWIQFRDHISTETLLNTMAVSCDSATTPSPTPSPSPNLPTCEASMPAAFTFKCFRKRIKRFRNRRVGTLDVFFEQGSGVFSFTGEIQAGADITAFNVEVTLSSGGSVIAIPVTLVSSGSSQVIYTINPFDVSVAEGSSSCCGMPLNVKMKVTLTKTGGTAKFTRVKNSTIMMLCKKICRITRGKVIGSVVPFSSSQNCPSCLTAA